MIIYYEQIGKTGFVTNESFSFSEDNNGFDVKFDGKIEKSDNLYLLTGKISLKISSLCDRCLEAMEINVEDELLLSLSPMGRYPDNKKEREVALNDDEMATYITPIDHADVGEIIREEALLLLPSKMLCKNDCKGICQTCGVNLNKDTCLCEKVVAGPWAILDTLK